MVVTTDGLRAIHHNPGKVKKKTRIIIEQDVSSVEYTGGGILGPMMIIKREKIKTWNRENNEDTRLRNHSKRRFEVR